MKRQQKGPLTMSDDPRLASHEVKDTPFGRGSYQSLWLFANGFGASVIQNRSSYGGVQGLYEVAMLKNGDLYYCDVVNGDVVGYLTWPQVQELLGRIADYRETRVSLWARVRSAIRGFITGWGAP